MELLPATDTAEDAFHPEAPEASACSKIAGTPRVLQAPPHFSEEVYSKENEGKFMRNPRTYQALSNATHSDEDPDSDTSEARKPTGSGKVKSIRPPRIPDSTAILQVYQDVLSACMGGFGLSEWRGYRQNCRGGRPLHDAISETIYIQLQRLKTSANPDSPIYIKLKDILGEHFEAGMTYSRNEFFALCKDQPLVPRLRNQGDEIGRLQEKIAKEIKDQDRQLSAAGATTKNNHLSENPAEFRDQSLPPPQYVTLCQMAAIVHRSKRTLEKTRKDLSDPLPDPEIKGAGGKPSEWRWDAIRGWLAKKFGRLQLPERFPLDRFRDGRAERS